MKKWLLSLIVVTAFAGYAYTQKIDSEEDSGVVKAPNIPNIQSQPPVAYKSGTYKGKSIDAYYGSVQVEATIADGKIAEVRFLEYPVDRRTSERINSQAMPYLIQEAIQAQTFDVDIVSGATQTSKAFRESLKSALSQAS